MNFITVKCYYNDASINKYEVILNLNYIVEVKEAATGRALIHTRDCDVPIYTADKYETVKDMIQKSVDAARLHYYGQNSPI